MKQITVWLAVLGLTAFSVGARAQTLEQSRQLTTAAKSWAALGATRYTYRLHVGGVFGGAEYRVEVKDGICKSWHVGGAGIGKTHFFERYHLEPTCDNRLIGDLLAEIRSEVARGYTIDELELDAKYGYVRMAHLDTTQLDDQGWGFEVTKFRLLSANPRSPN